MRIISSGRSWLLKLLGGCGMKYKDLAEKFGKEVMAPAIENKEISEQTFKAWLLIFLFEIHGDLDSIAANLFKLEKDYAEMLEMQRERMNGK
jgi:hypothetical protein